MSGPGGVKVDKLHPGSAVYVLSSSEPWTEPAYAMAQELAVVLQALVVCLEPGQRISGLDEEEMRAEGWVRAEIEKEADNGRA